MHVRAAAAHVVRDTPVVTHRGRSAVNMSSEADHTIERCSYGSRRSSKTLSIARESSGAWVDRLVQHSYLLDVMLHEDVEDSCRSGRLFLCHRESVDQRSQERGHPSMV